MHSGLDPDHANLFPTETISKAPSDSTPVHVGLSRGVSFVAA